MLVDPKERENNPEARKIKAVMQRIKWKVSWDCEVKSKITELDVGVLLALNAMSPGVNSLALPYNYPGRPN